VLSQSQEQYYVSSANGQIVIYRGFDYQILGYKLNHVYTQTGIPLKEVSKNDLQMVSSYPAGSLARAQNAVKAILADIATCKMQYTQLRSWVSRDKTYLAELEQANKHNRPTRGIRGPGAMPAVGPFCQGSTAYGIPANSVTLTPAAHA
jgi:hypothetical protein